MKNRNINLLGWILFVISTIGFIKSKMTDEINEDTKNLLISKIPMDRLGTGEDVANTTAFLCSDSAGYITGETIHVNGGMYMA